MAFPAFLDTCVLFSATLTDALLRIAEEDAFRPQWSAGVLSELQTVLERESGLAPEQASRRISLMQGAFPTAEVADYESLIDAMTCHPKDRHVLAAAVAGGSEVLVTFNLKDFTDDALAPHDVVALSPDSFLLDQLDLYPAKVGRALLGQMTEATRPPLTMGQLLGRLSRGRLGFRRRGAPTRVRMSGNARTPDLIARQFPPKTGSIHANALLWPPRSPMIDGAGHARSGTWFVSASRGTSDLLRAHAREPVVAGQHPTSPLIPTG